MSFAGEYLQGKRSQEKLVREFRISYEDGRECDFSRSVVPDSVRPSRLLCPWDSPGKNTGVGCHFLLQGIFLTQGPNSGLLHCTQILYCLSHQGNPKMRRSQARVKSQRQPELWSINDTSVCVLLEAKELGFCNSTPICHW